MFDITLTNKIKYFLNFSETIECRELKEIIKTLKQKKNKFSKSELKELKNLMSDFTKNDNNCNLTCKNKVKFKSKYCLFT